MNISYIQNHGILSKNVNPPGHSGSIQATTALRKLIEKPLG